MSDLWYSVDVDPPDDTVWVWGPDMTVDDKPVHGPHLAFAPQGESPGRLYWWSYEIPDDVGEGKPVDGVTHWCPFTHPDPPDLIGHNEDNLEGLLLDYAKVRYDLEAATSVLVPGADQMERSRLVDWVIETIGLEAARSLAATFKESRP